jgi:hypothetical protein
VEAGRRHASIDVWHTAGSEAGLAAAELLVSNALDLDRKRLLASVREDAGRPKSQRHGSAYDRDTVVLTPEEFQGLVKGVDALLAPYRRDHRPEPPQGARSYSASFLLARDP